MVRSLGRVAPELDLTSNRALCDLCGQSGIEDEFVGYLDGLAHARHGSILLPSWQVIDARVSAKREEKNGTLLPPGTLARIRKQAGWDD